MTAAVPLTRERVCAPLNTALNRLERLLVDAPAVTLARAELDQARVALYSLEASLPTAYEVLAEFLSASGPVENSANVAQDEARRAGTVDPALTKRLGDECLQRVETMFSALAPTPQAAATALEHVASRRSLISQALDEAQRDGCERGNYTSTIRDDYVMWVLNTIEEAARDFAPNPNPGPSRY